MLQSKLLGGVFRPLKISQLLRARTQHFHTAFLLTSMSSTLRLSFDLNLGVTTGMIISLSGNSRRIKFQERSRQGANLEFVEKWFGKEGEGPQDLPLPCRNSI